MQKPLNVKYFLKKPGMTVETEKDFQFQLVYYYQFVLSFGLC
jgi:hypothetical protein